VQMVSPGLSLLVLVALSNQSGRSAQKAFEACMKACPQVFECQLISGPFDYSLRMRCRDMEHYRVLTETWLNNDELHIDDRAVPANHPVPLQFTHPFQARPGCQVHQRGKLFVGDTPLMAQHFDDRLVDAIQRRGGVGSVGLGIHGVHFKRLGRRVSKRSTVA